MPWMTRRGRKYFYKNIKIDGRTRSIYVGGGAAGEAAAKRQAERNAARLRQREELRALRSATAALIQLIDQLAAEVELLLRAALIASGWYSHRNGEWRFDHGRRQTGRNTNRALAAGVAATGQ